MLTDDQRRAFRRDGFVIVRELFTSQMGIIRAAPLGLCGIVLGAAPVLAQSAPPSDAYVPITPAGRVEWVVAGSVGPRSLGVGVISSAWQTAWNVPEEWHRSWRGFGKRYLQREVDVTLSNSIEAGVGSLWGEEPRYVRAPGGSVKARAAHAARSVVLARRRDGHFAPAWGRYTANVANNLIENAWLPPSVTTPGATTLRCATAFAGRLAGNLFDEFWPDIKQRLRR
jgi:hypothetical protein